MSLKLDEPMGHAIKMAWHEWRADVWQWRYIIARGKLASTDRFGPQTDEEKKVTEAEKMFAEGLCCYHRLKAGIPL